VLLDSRVNEIVQFDAGGSRKENSNDANGYRRKKQVAVGRLADSGK